MDFATLKKKPAKLIMENNILDDIVYLSDNIDVLVSKAKIKVDNNFRDFLIVILNAQNVVQFIITYKEFSNLINSLSNFLGSHQNNDQNEQPRLNYEIRNIDLEQFRIQIEINAIEENAEVEKALESIRDNNLEVLVVVNSERKYVGKIKRSSLKRNVTELID